ncbi:2-oxoglutarate dehydrogenase E3 [Desulfovibrio desulfuricans]|nr:2-oxoglutarate dehydrogenase E3 [Desulfovibrio desulfuricans]
MTYDVVILGAGPGGSRAALEAAAAGLRVAIVDKGSFGGTCLNWGCIPTKLLLGGTAAHPLLEVQKKLKTAQGPIDFDLTALQARKTRFINGTRQALEKQLRQAGIEVITGTARLAGPGHVEVVDGEGTRELAARNVIVATGSVPASFPGLAPDGEAVLDSTALLDVTEVPDSLIIVGGGAIGLEMGDFFSRLGTAITIVEGLDRLAPTEDPEIGQTLGKLLKREGWAIHTGRRVASLSTVEGKAQLRFEDGTELVADKALMAVGRRPATAGLGLETAGATLLGAGWVETNDHLLAAPGLYAIGDVNGRTLLAHAADHQARFVISHIASGSASSASGYPAPVMPSCIYGHTEVMRAGATVAELVASGHDVHVSTSQLIANPIAQAYGTTGGFIRVLWVEGQVRGISAVGHGVSHLVTLATVIVSQRWRREDVHGIIFAHPTLDEALEAALLAPSQKV